MEEAGNNVVGVDGIQCVSVPIGSPEIMQHFVATKASEIIADVKKLQVESGPLIHLHHLRFCQYSPGLSCTTTAMLATNETHVP